MIASVDMTALGAHLASHGASSTSGRLISRRKWAFTR